MIVVADAGPLHYLILIGAVDVLGPLYNRVVLPEAVAQELRYQRAESWGPPREGAILNPSV
jgi:predicted nucleic acid-binding protein